MMIQGYVVKRMKERQASKDDRVIEEFRNKLEEDIQNHLKEIPNMYVHLRKATELILCDQNMEIDHDTSSSETGSAEDTQKRKRKMTDENDKRVKTQRFEKTL